MRLLLTMILWFLTLPVWSQTYLISHDQWMRLSRIQAEISIELENQRATWENTLKELQNQQQDYETRIEESGKALQSLKIISAEREQTITDLENYIDSLKAELDQLKELISILKSSNLSLVKSRGQERQVLEDKLRDQAIKNAKQEKIIQDQKDIIRGTGIVIIVETAVIVLLVVLK